MKFTKYLDTDKQFNAIFLAVAASLGLNAFCGGLLSVLQLVVRL